MTEGKYAIFVWPAYAISALAFAWMLLDSLLSARRWKRKVAALERDRERGDQEGSP
jgi:heme exporter protein D